MPDTETRIAEIRDRLQDATKGTWGTYYDGAVYHLAADMRVVDESCGRQIGQVPDGEDKMQAFHDAMFIGRSPDDVRFLLDRVADLEATLERYVGKEPTVAEEMAYLNRCLNAVHDLCREAEKQATRWENPLPVPEWVAAVRKAAGGEGPVEDELVNLRAMLADREREIAELKADEPTLDDDQPAAPR